MDERYDSDKVDEIMLPGFRFHPTDEELVGFYLKRKTQHRPLPIELIKQLDIYKYDPWDLPKLTITGEKEWYFYCPRDRKYRNSARPNRVTGTGFWKATGTDRPIYSSEGSKCIGLKKSLVFYTGKAAKGVKTDWMMHEFRLPCLSNSATPKRFGDRNLPADDAWAICRIFKKTSSIAQRALSHSWVSPLPETTSSSILVHGTNSTHFCSESMTCINESRTSTNQFCSNNDIHQSSTSFSPINIPSNSTISKQSFLPILNENFTFSSYDMSANGNCLVDVASMLLNFPPPLLGETDEKGSEDIVFGGSEQDYGSFSITSPQEIMPRIMGFEEEETWLRKNLNTVQNLQFNDQYLESARSLEFPFALPGTLPNTWTSNFSCDDSLQCPSDKILTSYFT